MSKEQNTQIQKALNYVRTVSLKQSKQEQQQTLILLLSAVSSHIRIMLNPPKPTAKKTKKSFSVQFNRSYGLYINRV